MHGYKIVRRMSEPAELGLVWNLKQSQLYAHLAKLECAGLVTADLHPQPARPPRKIYRLTPQGLEAYLQWIERPVMHGRQMRLDFLVKLYFAQQEAVQTALKLIERQHAACQGWLEILHKKAAEAASDQVYARLVRRYRAQQIEAMLFWLEGCQQMLTEAHEQVLLK